MGETTGGMETRKLGGLRRQDSKFRGHKHRETWGHFGERRKRVKMRGSEKKERTDREKDGRYDLNQEKDEGKVPENGQFQACNEKSKDSD